MGRDETLELDYIPPLDWAYFLRHHAFRALAGVEAVTDDRYTRTVSIGGDVGSLTVEHHPTEAKIVATVEGPARRHAAVITRGVRRMFDLDLDPAAVRAGLGSDAHVGPLVAARPGLRIPGAWCPFEMLIRTVVGQQVTVKAATTVVGRLIQRHGRRLDTGASLFPTPAALADADLADIGMPATRAATIRVVARAVADGAIDFDAPATARPALLALPGIGPWTVEYFAMKGLGDADAWPGTDLVLKRVVERLAGTPRPGAFSDRWRPFRAYAAVHLWNDPANAG